MSAIPPPNWMSSIIGAQGAQQRADDAKHRADTEDARHVDPTAFKNKLSEAISTDDRDTEVYADAEGTGGQGRSSSSDKHEHKDEHADDQQQPPADNACGGSLDFSA